jgi:hypothetical protein
VKIRSQESGGVVVETGMRRRVRRVKRTERYYSLGRLEVPRYVDAELARGEEHASEFVGSPLTINGEFITSAQTATLTVFQGYLHSWATHAYRY